MSRSVPIFLTLSLIMLASCSDGEGGRMTFTGLMDATTVRVSAETPGRVLSIMVDEGQRVSKGDTIARINAERLDFQSTQQEAMLSELEFQLGSAAERRTAAKIQRDNLARKAERFKTLFEQKAATRQTVDDLVSQLDAADAELRSADQTLAALGSKRTQLTAGKNVVESQRSDARIIAPLSGRVVVRYAEPGEMLGVGSPICEIADLTAMWTRIYLTAKELPQVRLDQEVSIHIDGIDTPLRGRVSWISDKAEFTPKSILTEETRASLVYAAKISIANPDGTLKIGMPVTITIDKAQ